MAWLYSSPVYGISIRHIKRILEILVRQLSGAAKDTSSVAILSCITFRHLPSAARLIAVRWRRQIIVMTGEIKIAASAL